MYVFGKVLRDANYQRRPLCYYAQVERSSLEPLVCTLPSASPHGVMDAGRALARELAR